MENKFYITTYWQSLDLMQAEFDKNTADYVYVRYDGVPHPRPRTEKDSFNASVIPAWSFGKLWDIMAILHMDYDFSTDETAEAVFDSIVNALIEKSRQINASNSLDI